MKYSCSWQAALACGRAAWRVKGRRKIPTSVLHDPWGRVPALLGGGVGGAKEKKDPGGGSAWAVFDAHLVVGCGGSPVRALRQDLTTPTCCPAPTYKRHTHPCPVPPAHCPLAAALSLPSSAPEPFLLSHPPCCHSPLSRVLLPSHAPPPPPLLPLPSSPLPVSPLTIPEIHHGRRSALPPRARRGGGHRDGAPPRPLLCTTGWCVAAAAAAVPVGRGSCGPPRRRRRLHPVNGGGGRCGR